jgi:hypothetical protein
MAAGQGFKTFVTGEVLTAGDVNGYLMQGINVFATTTARDAAITAPAEGQFAFTKDTNGLWYYDGAAWVASGATGDIEGVTAGIGISGGGTSGTVTVTNSMATAIDAKGDLVAGTGADTFSRLAVGANDTVLTADSTAATGLKWAAAAAPGANWSLLNSGGTALTGATTITVSGISGKDKILIMVKGAGNTTVSTQYKFRFNADTGSNYYYAGNLIIGGSTYDPLNFKSLEMDARDAITYGASSSDTASRTNGFCFITGANSAGVKAFQVSGGGTPPAASNAQWLTNVGGYYNSATTISSISVVTSGSNFNAGTVFVYTSA